MKIKTFNPQKLTLAIGERTQSDVADEAGIYASRLSQYLDGTASPLPRTVKRITDVLDVELDSVYDELDVTSKLSADMERIDTVADALQYATGKEHTELLHRLDGLSDSFNRQYGRTAWVEITKNEVEDVPTDTLD